MSVSYSTQNKLQSGLFFNLVSRVVVSSQLLSPEYRFFPYYYIRFYTARKSKRLCYVTGRGRGYVSKFGVSRLIFKEYAIIGAYSGIKRFVW